jgi:hypothetical protein
MLKKCIFKENGLKKMKLKTKKKERKGLIRNIVKEMVIQC